LQESPIYTRTYEFMTWLLPQATKFPRAHRFGLGERVIQRALDFQETLIDAGMHTKIDRLNSLNQADRQLAHIKQLIRLCKDLELISLGQYEFAARLLVEIGRLLGGWKKKESKNGTG
jgi:hypothetical protein